MTNLIQYFKSIKGEFKNVVWPSRERAIVYTVLVILISLVCAAYMGFLDYLFLEGYRILS